MAVSSARNLQAGTGTVSTTSGTKLLTFSSSQSFKEGSAIVVDPSGTPQYFTIDTGADKSWTVMQDATASVSGKSFNQSSQLTTAASRARGGAASVLIPNAAHFMYRSALDDQGAPDFFTYFDTLFPENGMHPYTKDPYAGVTAASTPGVQAVIPDIGTRVRRLEGALRANPTNGDITSPDKRLAQMEARLNALEAWANRVNTNSPPATTSTTTYTVDQLTQAGDAA